MAKTPPAVGSEEAPVALVPDEALVPTAQGFPQGSHDGLPIMGILPGFLLVEADHVTVVVNPDLLHLERREVFGARQGNLIVAEQSSARRGRSHPAEAGAAP
jgi:hypothetical protein